MNIGSLATRHGRYRPDQIALVCAGERLTWRALDAGVNRTANSLLDEGVAKGDRVATVLPNRRELLELYLAAGKIGAVVVPLSPLLGAATLARLMRDAGASLVVADPEFSDLASATRAELPATDAGRWLLAGDFAADGFTALGPLVAAASGAEPPDARIVDSDPFNIIYSSGTTGEPKGIVHTHYVRGQYCTGFASSWRMTPESVVLHTGSIVFNGAFVTLMPCLYTGATYVLHPRFDVADMVRAVAAEGVTHVMMVPSQIVALLDSEHFDRDALASLEVILSLGAPLPLGRKQQLDEALPGRFHELYGLTEGFVTILDREDFPRKPESVGVPPPFFEMRIVAEDGRDLPTGGVGEIVGRGPILMPGYYARPDLTADVVRDGWLHTGDLGRVDEDGFLYLVDRKKDLIISGGVNVYPRDIEEVLASHPAVREAAVFGVPDQKWGETPIAAVTVRVPDAPDAAGLAAWVNERVEARFQRVHSIMILEDFPRNVAGKILKRELRERYLQRGGDDG